MAEVGIIASDVCDTGVISQLRRQAFVVTPPPLLFYKHGDDLAVAMHMKVTSEWKVGPLAGTLGAGKT